MIPCLMFEYDQKKKRDERKTTNLCTSSEGSMMFSDGCWMLPDIYDLEENPVHGFPSNLLACLGCNE